MKTRSPWLYPAAPKPAKSPLSGLQAAFVKPVAAAFATLAVFAVKPDAFVLPSANYQAESAEPVISQLPAPQMSPVKPPAPVIVSGVRVNSAGRPINDKGRFMSFAEARAKGWQGGEAAKKTSRKQIQSAIDAPTTRVR